MLKLELNYYFKLYSSLYLYELELNNLGSNTTINT